MTKLNKDDKLNSFFSNLASDYDVFSRLSETCALQITKKIGESISKNKVDSYLDIGAGTGFFDTLILNNYPNCSAILLDTSASMLQEAQALFRKYNMESRAVMILDDAYNLPFFDGYIKFATMFFVFHLLSESQNAINEVRRVLSKDGILMILTYEPEDMQLQIYHSMFPRFFKIDSERFFNAEKLTPLFEKGGFSVREREKFHYQIEYPDVETVIKLVKTKPMSTLSFYNDDEFMLAVNTFEDRLRDKFGSGKVINESKLTLWELKAK